MAAASMESRRLKESRAPASESAASPGSVYAGELSESDRRGWMDWAVDRLHELQGTLDSLEGNSGPRDREIRTRVAQAANEVVVIYGAAETGDLRKITDALTALEENFEEAYDMLCMRKDPSFNGGASSSTL